MARSNELQVTPGSDSPKAQDRLTDRVSMLWIALFLVVFLIVDVWSLTTVYLRNDSSPPFWEILLLESTAVFACLLSVPVIARLAAAVPIGESDWRIAIPFHVSGSLVVALLVVACFIGLRKWLFPLLLDDFYTFGNNWTREFFYEYRKIALFYGGSLCVFTFGRSLAESRRQTLAATEVASSSRRITLKSGGRSFLVPGNEFLWAKSDGNYLDITTGRRTFMIRGTLTKLESMLGQASVHAARVHRSYVVNLEHVQETRPDGEGGLRILMSDQTVIPCSRRFRPVIEQEQAEEQ